MNMKKIISRSSLIELAPFEFALKVADIKFSIKNEFASGAIGDLPFTEVWPELWVINGDQLKQAKDICSLIEQEVNQINIEWNCTQCEEVNASSFEFCWYCGELRRT